MAQTETLARSSAGLQIRLSLMMFLQYFVQGCYLPIVSVYLEEALGFDKQQIGLFGSALAIGPLFAPFVIGQLVDRQAPSQVVLAICHGIAAVVMWGLYSFQSFGPIMVLGTLYSIVYVPTLMLTNSLAFHHLQAGEKEFPWIRLWGTIGFIVPAWLVERVFLYGVEGDDLNSRRGIALAAASVASALMTVYALSLPHTPPSQKARTRFAPAEVIGLLAQRRFLVLTLVTLVISLVHKFYFVLNAPFLKAVLRSGNVQGAWEGSISSLGQIAEIGVMAGLGFLIARVGFKRTLLIGAVAYLSRCLIFAGAYGLAAPFAVKMTVICAGQMLHGLCFGCFLAGAFMYLDRTTPEDLRGSVQNIYGTFVLGVGFIVGGVVSGWIAEGFKNANDTYNWTAIWLAAAVLAGFAVVAFALFFPREDDARIEKTL